MNSSKPTIDPIRLRRALETTSRELLNRRQVQGHWIGQLSSSALSTATAISSLAIYRNACLADSSSKQEEIGRLDSLLDRGLQWLLAHQNSDGGWGDTDRSYSNISTTFLVQSALILSDTSQRNESSIHDSALQENSGAFYLGHALAKADRYVRDAGGMEAVVARYGSDRTFSAPILTNAALAGLVPWQEVPPLPFEKAALPMSLFKVLNLQVVSYAIPALVAIGQVRFHYYRDPYRFIGNQLKKMAIPRTLKLIETMQPASGGYLEAAPLTAFVVMSLVACGHKNHPVVTQGIRFLVDNVRADGSWPIDTNLATWGTSLSIAALGSDILDTQPNLGPLIDWLLSCQHQERHPFTGAKPGGWGWTDLSGAVPDGDDTPGALVALAELSRTSASVDRHERIQKAVRAALYWLISLRNADGGIPTFCRGWGVLPFDKSSTDLTAHCLRAFLAWRTQVEQWNELKLLRAMDRSMQPMLEFLKQEQKEDGSWIPLWFGNQDQQDDANPCYGTAKVLKALLQCRESCHSTGFSKAVLEKMVQAGTQWLVQAQHPDGSWGSVEESALAIETLSEMGRESSGIAEVVHKGAHWLIDQVESGNWTSSAPIGLYFAKLWYYEELYPIIFTTSALRNVLKLLES